MNNHSIWVIDDDDSIRWVLERALQKANYRVSCFADARDVRLALERESPPHAIISDIRMPGESGLELLEEFRDRYAGVPVIIITAHSDLDSAVSAYRGGAFEYLPKPFDIDELIDATARACEWHDAQLGPVQEDHPMPQPATELIGEAPAMQSVFRAIGRLARSNMTVLISGESGSGKELIARALHRHSPRAGKTFIALNVAAIPHDLVESELFGHEKGAFTGAHALRRGRFEQADGGTLFLDEIGDMSIALQTRLLRVLADGQFYRVGGHAPVSVDVRIITATHRDLEALVAEQKFREDLFHRLNVIRINVPTLRERREDIPALLEHFLAQAARELDTETKRPSDEVIAHLQSLNWPGNVRELENLCRWMTVMGAGKKIGFGDLPKELTPSTGIDEPDWESALKAWALTTMASGEPDLLAKAQPIFERTLIECAMQKTRNNRQNAATLIGWGRNTLTRKIKQLGID